MDGNCHLNPDPASSARFVFFIKAAPWTTELGRCTGRGNCLVEGAMLGGLERAIASLLPRVGVETDSEVTVHL